MHCTHYVKTITKSYSGVVNFSSNELFTSKNEEFNYFTLYSTLKSSSYPD